MERIEHEGLIQGTPVWQAFRLEHDGASEAAAMLGETKKTTRSELMRMKHTGVAKEFSDWVQENILDHGHAVEALARPLVEDAIGEELFPVTYSLGRMSASCDGITIDGRIAFEHKQANQQLLASVAAGDLPNEYQPQCQQIMMVTGAEKVIFVCSDGTLDNFEMMDVLPDPYWIERIEAGWAQFHRDLDVYVPKEIIEKPKAAPIMDLPVLFVQAKGEITKTNMPEYRKAIELFVSKAIALPKTEQEFADAKLQAKMLREAGVKLEERKADMLAQTTTIGAVVLEIDFLKELVNKTALGMEKLVESEEARLKRQYIIDGQVSYAAHVAALQTEIEPIRLVVPSVDFAAAIKGKRTLKGCEDGASTALANGKIDADAIAKALRGKLAWYNEAAKDHKFLFSDIQTVIYKDEDDFKLAVKARIDAHASQEAARIEAETQRIRAEEAKRAQEVIDAAARDNARKVVEQLAEQQRQIAENRRIADAWNVSVSLAAAEAREYQRVVNLLWDAAVRDAVASTLVQAAEQTKEDAGIPALLQGEDGAQTATGQHILRSAPAGYAPVTYASSGAAKEVAQEKASLPEIVNVAWQLERDKVVAMLDDLSVTELSRVRTGIERVLADRQKAA